MAEPQVPLSPAPEAETDPQVAPAPRPAIPETATTLLLDLLCRPRQNGQRAIMSALELRGIIGVLKARHPAATLIEEMDDYLYWFDPLPDAALDLRRSVERMFAGVDNTALRRAIRIDHEARELIATSHGEHVAQELADAIVEFVAQSMIDTATLIEPRDIVYCTVDDDVIRGGGAPPPAP